MYCNRISIDQPLIQLNAFRQFYQENGAAIVVLMVIHDVGEGFTQPLVEEKSIWNEQTH